MKTLWYLGGLLALAIAFAGCGGGGGGQSSGVNPLPNVSPTPTAISTPAGQGSSASNTFTVQANPTMVPLPGVAGFRGSLAIPGIIGLGSVTVTVSTVAPVGVTTLQNHVLSKARAAVASSVDSGLLYVTLTPTQAISFDGAPGVTLTIPPGYDLRGRNVYVAQYLSNALLPPWTPVAGPGSETGTTVTIPSTTNRPISIPAGSSAYFAVFSTGIASLELATPSATMTIGSPSQPTVRVDALDELGAPISGTLPAAISITSSDTSGRTTLGATSVTSVPATVPLAYDGKGDEFTLTASLGTISNSEALITTLPKEMQILNAPNYIQGLIVGPGGNFWTNIGSGIGSLTPGAQFVAFPDPDTHHVGDGYDLVEGSDGNIWSDYRDNYYEVSGINRVTPTGVFISYPFTGTLQTSSSEVDSMVLGPDGAVWFGLSSSDLYSPGIGIGRIDTSGNIRQVVSTTIAPSNLVVGPDGNFWFSLGPNVAKLTPSGVLTTYTLPGSTSQTPLRFVVGPDGNFWAPFAYGSQNLMKFSTSGTVVSSTPISYDPVWDFPFSGASYLPFVGSLVVDHAGNVYFTDVNTQGVVRITPSGSVSAYPTFSTRSNIVDNPMQLVVGNDGYLYLTSTAVLDSTQAGLVPALTKIDPASW